jgi:alpha-1,6-mannosyltransferase
VLYREARVHELIAREAPDVIEGSSVWSAGWFAARYRGPGAKALIYHQDPVAVYPQTLLDRWLPARLIDEACFPYWQYVRRLARHFDSTVVAGHWLAKRLGDFGIPRPQAVPFGIDKALFSPEHASSELKRELLARAGAPAGAALLVCISRHHPEKRLSSVLRAFERAQRQRPMGLVLFGSGPLMPWIERTAAGIPGVYLAGYVDDRQYIAKALASADALVHGSAAETYGFVIAEALCAGTPIVAPDRGGAFELCEPSYSETYAPGDIDAAAKAILRLLERDRTALGVSAVQAGARNVQTTAQHFDALFEHYAQLRRLAS